MKRLFASFAAGALVCCGSAIALAQGAAYPSRPVTVIVPNLPGGSSDLIARAVGARLQQTLGQPIVVDNKPGASELIGTELLTRASPDGYTIAILSNALTINETLSPGRKYAAERDLVPVARLVELPLALIVRSDIPAQTLKEFVDYAKANPGKLNYGHVGQGAPHFLTMEWFKRKAGLDIPDVPYKSTPPVYAALAGGEIQLTLTALGGAAQLMQGGKARALVSMSRRRPISQPNLPALSEVGYAEFDLVPWMGIFAPAKIPADLAAKLEAELVAAIESPEVKDRLQRVGLEPSPLRSKEFADLVKRDIGNWAGIIRDVGVKPQ